MKKTDKNIILNERYKKVLEDICGEFPHWKKLSGKTILLSGASGMIGSFLVDTLMFLNQSNIRGERCKIIAIGRRKGDIAERFAPWLPSGELSIIEQDIREPLTITLPDIDYIIHAASTTHPRAYATEPINTILSNILGTKNLLDISRDKKSRFLLLSSVEVYGENRGDVDYFDESYCGYINCNTLRAGYPEGKRAGEALCQAYISEYGVDANIIRLSRIYGPTMRQTDSKALAQFIRNGVNAENIVLKSTGSQYYSYLHVADAVQAILWVLLCGNCGEAYNAADEKSDITLRELAELIADYVGTKVVFDLPDATERKGYSTATKALLDASKLKELGWRPCYDIYRGVHETINILRELKRAN